MEQNNRILVVDDDREVLDAYQSILSLELVLDTTEQGALLFGDAPVKSPTAVPRPYHLSCRETGEEALARVRRAVAENRPFAVAFLDMSMPGMDGAETARKMWELDPAIKIVVVTGYGNYQSEEIVRMFRREDLFLLRKPFHPEEIRQFARALTRQWDLERERDSLSRRLASAYEELSAVNAGLEQKVEQQARQLIQSEKMAAIGLLAAGVAHEINNPIAFVDSNLNTLKKYAVRITELIDHYARLESSVDQGEQAQAAAMLGPIRVFKKTRKIDFVLRDMVALTEESLDGVNRVKGIVRDLKTFSRADQDEISSIDVNETLDSAINIIRNELKHKARIIRDYSDLPPIECSPQRISQVFLNLLVNAAQAIESDGIVMVASRYLQDNENQPGESGRVEVIVTDNGRGIEQEQVAHIFDPFFTTKAVGNGVGLGLSIAYDIVKAHAGTIRVESEPNKGSIFTVTLPVKHNWRQPPASWKNASCQHS